MVREILAGKRKPGESFTERGYAFVADTKPMTVEHKAVGRGGPDAAGRPDRCRRTCTRSPTRAWAAKGDVYCEPRILMPLRFDMPVMAMHFVATIATRGAGHRRGRQTRAELFVSTMLKAKVTGSLDPTQAASVLYTMQLPDETRRSTC